MTDNKQQSQFVPFEMVREEKPRAGFVAPRGKIAIFAAMGILALLGIIALGVLVVFIGVLVVIPLMILRAIAARLSHK